MSKNFKVEAEGGELVLSNNNGSYAIIPKDKREEALGYLKGGCNDCLNSLIQELPKMSDYAEDGTLVYQLYEQKTGKKWRTAREEGLTDGSYSANMEIRRKLLSGEELTPINSENKQTGNTASIVAERQNNVGTSNSTKRGGDVVNNPIFPTGRDVEYSPNPNFSYKVDEQSGKVFKSKKGENNWYEITGDNANKVRNFTPNSSQKEGYKFQTFTDRVMTSDKMTESEMKEYEKSKREDFTLDSRPSAKYQKNSKGEWFIKNTGDTDYVKITDGRRIDTLNKYAYKNGEQPIANKVTELVAEAGNYVQSTLEQAKRGLNKYAGLEVEEQKVKVQNTPKEVLKEDDVSIPFSVIAEVDDLSGKSGDKIMSYRNQWDNDQGFEYIATPVKGGRKSTDEWENVEGVGHFLLDASATKSNRYSHDFNKKFIQDAIKKDDYVPVFENIDDNRVKLKYKKASEISNTEMKNGVITPLRQFKFGDIDRNKTRQPSGFNKGINEAVKKDGSGTYLIFKDKDGYSRFSGGSVVFIFKNDKGKTIVRDFAGSFNQIMQEGEDILKSYSLTEDQLTIGYHDVGSFSAKPRAKDGKLTASQWEGFNPKSHTGGALLIPKQK